MFHRLTTWLILAFIPAVLLSLYLPERAFRGVTPEGRYQSTPGADIVAIVRDGCPHCAKFEELANEQGWNVEYHEITDIGTPELFEEIQNVAPLLQQGVPTIIINGKVVQGYETHETTGVYLKKLVEECRAQQKGCLPFRAFLATAKNVEVTSAAGVCTEKCETDQSKYVFDLWMVGKVDLLTLSLPALSVLLGFLDGFNPCAMWVLITLLTLLIGTNDMRKVWVIGGTFLFVSGAIYYLFIAAWLNVFLVIGYNFWVQKIIGAIAIGAGGFYLFEAFGKDPNVCQVTDHARRQRIIERMKHLTQAVRWPAMIIGVSVLAISVNMIELVCTAGLPAIFTQILAFNDVSTLARYSYLALYILLYMIDDLIIFGIAVYTLHATGLTTKYRRFTLIFGGLLMYALGFLLIFWPDALVFS
ncbi:glutaredoxin [Candidatus Peregrinibacteria bacterium]|nr:glutaredoxin [Candidatus Peregrinibacteria bacterium]